MDPRYTCASAVGNELLDYPLKSILLVAESRACQKQSKEELNSDPLNRNHTEVFLPTDNHCGHQQQI